MKVQVESTGEAHAAITSAATHCKTSAERMGHAAAICDCGLCAAIRAMDKAADELARFCRGF